MPKTILVDDDPLMVRLYDRTFKLHNIDGQVLDDPEKLIETLRQNKEKPKLVMLDVTMPKISGLELLKQIKADSSLKAIPVVMLSNLSTAGENMRGQALKLGAADYVIKSEYGPEELVQKINQYL